MMDGRAHGGHLLAATSELAALVRRDAGDNFQSRDQEVLQPVVDLVDAAAQPFEIGGIF